MKEESVLLKLMREKGISQKRLANRTGVTRQAVSGWLKGAKPRGMRLRAAAEVLGVELWDLTGILAEPGEGECVQVLGFEALCGTGVVPGPAPRVRWVELRGDFLRSLPGVTPASSFGIVRARGKAMEPAVPEGAYALIDRSQRDPRSGGIFCLFVGERFCLGRVASGPLGAEALEFDDPAEPALPLLGESPARSEVVGRLVCVLERSALS